MSSPLVTRHDDVRPSPALRPPPLQKFLVQTLLVGRRRPTGLRWARSSGNNGLCCGVLVKPFLGRWEALQARDIGVQVDVLPLRVKPGALQRGKTVEQIVGQAGDPLVAIRGTIPVECRKDGRHGYGLDR